VLKCDVPSNGTRRRSCGEKLLREMRERSGVDPVYATVISGWCRFDRIEDAAQVFDEMPVRTVLKNARVLLFDEASRVQDAVGRMLQRRAARTHAVREELQYGGYERIRTEAARPRVEDVEGC
jgi:pentatricopeptide repeat protein